MASARPARPRRASVRRVTVCSSACPTRPASEVACGAADYDEDAVLVQDPLFDPDGLLMPSDESPAIDAGSLACDGEPACGHDVCMSDLGYYAGTDQAGCRP